MFRMLLQSSSIDLKGKLRQARNENVLDPRAVSGPSRLALQTLEDSHPSDRALPKQELQVGVEQEVQAHDLRNDQWRASDLT